MIYYFNNYIKELQKSLKYSLLLLLLVIYVRMRIYSCTCSINHSVQRTEAFFKNGSMINSLTPVPQFSSCWIAHVRIVDSDLQLIILQSGCNFHHLTSFCFRLDTSNTLIVFHFKSFTYTYDLYIIVLIFMYKYLTRVA